MKVRELYPGWKTICRIGSGSFGAVYEINRTLPNGKIEKAALKVISIPQSEGDIDELYSNGYDAASITEQFNSYLSDIVNEYSMMSEIKGYTNVVYCDDVRYIQHDDGFGWDIFIKMELLTPLVKLRDMEPLERSVQKLGRDICSALVLCREKGIIHRDIKPQNIFVSEHGDYKLGDFGIAKTVEKTTGGTKIGTYSYMAPEVYNNQPYGTAADIYSLGLVMYWLLNEHRLPFLPMPPKTPSISENEQARLRRFRGEPIPSPENGSPELKRIVLKACAYDTKERYHTADEMLADLDALEGEHILNAESEETSTAEMNDYSSQPENDTVDDLDMHSDETARTVGVKWKNESEETQLAEKPSKKRRHKILPIAAAVILICAVAGIYGYTHCWFGHVWEAATCTEPETCARCGAVSGNALGHDWQVATCTEPITCTRCNMVDMEAIYQVAQALMDDGKYMQAMWAFSTISYRDSQIKSQEARRCVLASQQTALAASECHTVGVLSDGTVAAIGKNYDGECDVSSWKDIVAVSAEYSHTVGLLSNGTVVTAGENDQGECDVSSWENVVAISTGEYHTVGLCSDGTVVATGENDYSECNVSDWKNIVAISAGFRHTVGLRSDGTVVATGVNYFGQSNVSSWKDIAAVSAGPCHTVGLRNDGTVVATGANDYGQCDVSGWKDIVAISTGRTHTVGLCSDGTVVATGLNNYGQCNISDWKNIVAISAGPFHTVGLYSDGTVVATGLNNYGQCNVSSWRNLDTAYALPQRLITGLLG